ncbi:ABC transporter ATP-binding protein [Alicyclobacillus sp. SO9]|uniref:ABC transporter ATP-binding protein n=1 Tax=Alicyclobacillus sp. SO9 TaxID=2665646 RepID=UPI0018E85F66|nr:ABC transporter ATP-binding protein [Alicyclobacillus sp. SO9]QQE77536.1 ABC transporter ATP-binding protein [Alicyclobacillus sp. SO9]
MTALVELQNVGKMYGHGVKTHALQSASMTFHKGELVVILGPSGSGKSTLLNLIGGLDSPSQGTVTVTGTDITALSTKGLSEYRRDKVGFIFQFYNLIPSLTAYENVELAASLSRSSLNVAKVLEKMGLTEILHHFPSQMSGGQQQRVAIARALVKNPPLLLCDEPTGALDYETGKSVLALLGDLSHEEGKTVVIVTHNSALAAMANRVVRLKDGHVIEDTVQTKAVPASQLTW